MNLRSLSLALCLIALAPHTAAAAPKAPPQPNLVLLLSVAKASITVDGIPKKVAGQRIELIVEPGFHVVQAEAEGFDPFQAKVTVPKAGAITVDVLLKVAAPLPSADTPVVIPTLDPPAPTPVPDPPKPVKRSTNRIAVYELKPEGEDPSLVRLLTESLLAEVRKLERVSAIGMAEVKEMLSFEQQRQLLGCSDDSGCLAEIGGALGVDELLTGTVGRVGDSHVVTFRRVDLARASIKGSFEKRVKADTGDELFAVVGPGVEALYPEFPLREGRQRGVADAIMARLHPPPLPQSVFFVTGGLTLVAGGIATWYSLAWGEEQAAFDAWKTSSEVQDPDAYAQHRAALDAATTSRNVLLLATGALAVVTLAEAFFTDWHPEETAALRVVPGGVQGSF